MASMSDGPPPPRALPIAGAAAPYTASASLPSTTIRSRPYALARSAAGCSTAVTDRIGVYSMYWLFSQTKTTGSFQMTARLSASWKAPMLVVPSPKKQTATCPDLRTCADHAAPAAIGRCAPTIASEPFRHGGSHGRAAGEGMAVAAIGAEGVVVGAHRDGIAGGDRLLTECEVAGAAHQVLEEQLIGALLEIAQLDHQLIEAQPRRAVDVSGRRRLGLLAQYAFAMTRVSAGKRVITSCPVAVTTISSSMRAALQPSLEGQKVSSANTMPGFSS